MQRILLRSPGFRSFSRGSFVGLAKISSCAFDACRIGRIGSGRLSKKSLFMSNRCFVASSSWAMISVDAFSVTALSAKKIPSIIVLQPSCRPLSTTIRTGFPLACSSRMIS